MRLYLYVILTLLSGTCSAVEVPAPIHGRNGELLAASCSAKELKKLKSEAFSGASNRKPEQAWSLVTTMLCGDKSSARLLGRHTAALVAVESYGIEEDAGPTYTLQPRSVVAPLSKQAWAAYIEKQDRDLMLWYRPAGVCMSAVRMRYVSSTWLIVGIGNACD